jgi:hypothetical protein
LWVDGKLKLLLPKIHLMTQTVFRSFGGLLLMVLCGLLNPVSAQQLSAAIRLNQIGFYPNAPKTAVILAEKVCLSK